MTPKFPITRNRIRNHFQYFWWQYALLAGLAIFGWNLLFTTTRYRPPESLKVEWYYEGPMTNATQQNADALLAELTPQLFPDMEEVTFTSVGMDDTYGAMQIMVWMAAGQGDLYMLTQDTFKSYATQGSMVDLQPYVDDGTLNVEGITLTKGYVKEEETGQTHLYGIPAGQLKGLEQYEIFPEGTILSMLVAGGNEENTLKLMAWLLDNMKE